MPDFSIELSLGGCVAGIDEVGRGPLAGPVVAAAVVLDGDSLPASLRHGLDDSKKLKPARRQELAALVRRRPASSSVRFIWCMALARTQ